MQTALTRLVLLGHPVAHSLSPLFQNAALRSAGLPVTYSALDVEPELLAATLSDLVRDNAAGNVTVPYKEAVYAACSRTTALAERVGAVNTFWCDDGELIGDNTDVPGVRAAIDAVLPLRLRTINAPLRVAILGAGGSAAAVLVALSHRMHLNLTCFTRTAERAVALSERLELPLEIADSADAAVNGADLVINTTPIGLRDDHLPVAPESLMPQAAVLDLVYRRGETPWVRACRERGHRAEDGLRMLVEQGATAFERWFDAPADRLAMWSVLEPRPEPG